MFINIQFTTSEDQKIFIHFVLDSFERLEPDNCDDPPQKTDVIVVFTELMRMRMIISDGCFSASLMIADEK